MSTVIIGLGETGLSTARYLAKNNIPCIIVDSRQDPPHLASLKNELPEIPVFTGGFSPQVLEKAATVILSPGVPKDHPDIIKSISKNTEIIGDIELFARRIAELEKLQGMKIAVAAITGSNGKSTVTSLLGEMAIATGLNVGIGGNLGKPALTLLEPNRALYVLELSSFQLETTDSLKPKVSTVLNISPDHMDRYASLEDYHAAKARIYNHSEVIVANRDDAYVFSKLPSGKSIISFGLDKPNADNYGVLSDSRDSHVNLAKGSLRLLPVDELQIFGRHNISNALAALALGEAINLPMNAMIHALKDFKGLPHRCEKVRVRNDVIWINDSKGTNVGATEVALQGLADSITGKWVMIAGGIGKNADFTPLKPLIAKHCRAVVLIGEASLELQGLLQTTTQCILANNMIDAVQKAAELAKPKDGVLLSPACSSLDMFRNFEERGNVFKKAVLGL